MSPSSPCQIHLHNNGPTIRISDDNCNDRLEAGEHIQRILPNRRTIGIGPEHPVVIRHLQALGSPSLEGVSLTTASSFLNALYAVETASRNGFRLGESLKVLGRAAKKLGGPALMIYCRKIGELRDFCLAQAWEIAKGSMVSGNVEAVLPFLENVRKLGEFTGQPLGNGETTGILLTAYRSDIAVSLWEAGTFAREGRVDDVRACSQKVLRTSHQLQHEHNVPDKILRVELDRFELKMARIMDFAHQMKDFIADGKGDLEEIMREYGQSTLPSS